MLRSLVLAAALVPLAAPAFAQIQFGPNTPNMIVTQGDAVLRRAPDRAWLTISTQVRDGKPTDARRKSTEAMNDVIKAIKGAGIRDEQIRTTGYSLTPEIDYRTPARNITGYVVRNQIEVRIDDLDRVGEVIDAANIRKDSGLSIVGPRFDLKNPQAAQAEALKLAVENAMMKAQAIAAGARRSLGPILRIEDSGVNTIAPPMPRQLMMGVAGGRGGGAGEAPPETPITAGEIEIRVMVTLTVAIQ